MIYIYINQGLKDINDEMDFSGYDKNQKGMMQIIRRCCVSLRMKWVEK